MKVLVFGNIASGKTTLINKLKIKTPFEVVAIDDYRIIHGDKTFEGEKKAREYFFESLTGGKNQFIECLGVGFVSEEVYNILGKSNEIIICITLIAPLEICKSRALNKDWDIPFFKPIDEIDSLIKRTHDKILAGEIFERWSRNSNVTFIEKSNIDFGDLEDFVGEVSQLIQKCLNGDIALIKNGLIEMQKRETEEYYGGEYMTYQKKIIERNPKLVKDRTMIEEFLQRVSFNGNVIDIGSGNCQWFAFVEEKINKYFAVELNSSAVFFTPENTKLTFFNNDIFDENFNIFGISKEKIDVCILSFLCSHFSDERIDNLFEKLKDVDCVIIIDSFWGNHHQEKYKSKELKKVFRRASEKKYITIMKRFFEKADLDLFGFKTGRKRIEYESGTYWFVCMMRKDI
jgi:SAM-dependent methyltransferase/GTPase SAR1 family protein